MPPTKTRPKMITNATTPAPDAVPIGRSSACESGACSSLSARIARNQAKSERISATNPRRQPKTKPAPTSRMTTISSAVKPIRLA